MIHLFYGEAPQPLILTAENHTLTRFQIPPRGTHLMAAGRLPLLLLLTALLLTSSPAAKETDPKPKKSKSTPTVSSPPDQLNGVPKKRPSSAVFRIHGDVYPLGMYLVSMSIGDPPKPYFLDVDTGSDLTWLQCDAPCVRCSKGPHPWYKPKKSGLVRCKEEVCVWLRDSLNQKDGCESMEQCDYEIEYADSGSSLGVLVTDVVSFRLTNSSSVRPRLTFGCGYDQQGAGLNKPSHADGVLGLGSGQSSIISQMRNQGVTRNVMGHCLSRKGGGYLFFGDDLVPYSGVTWAPMSRTSFKNYYSPGKATFFLGKESLGVKEQPVVFDSGSSYTYFTTQPYKAFLSALKNDLAKKPLEVAIDPDLPVCWKGAKPFKSLADVKKYFKSLVLNIMNGRRTVQMEIPAENYLIITKYGNVCSGILDGTGAGLKGLNLIGDISLQDLMVIYDNEKQQIGWSIVSCDRIPNADEFEGPQLGSLGFS